MITSFKRLVAAVAFVLPAAAVVASPVTATSHLHKSAHVATHHTSVHKASFHKTTHVASTHHSSVHKASAHKTHIKATTTPAA